MSFILKGRLISIVVKSVRLRLHEKQRNAKLLLPFLLHPEKWSWPINWVLRGKCQRKPLSPGWGYMYMLGLFVESLAESLQCILMDDADLLYSIYICGVNSVGELINTEQFKLWSKRKRSDFFELVNKRDFFFCWWWAEATSQKVLCTFCFRLPMKNEGIKVMEVEMGFVGVRKWLLLQIKH